MTRDAGPLPRRISAFTTGLQSYTEANLWQAATLFQPAACKKLQHTSLDLTLWMILRGIHPVIGTSCGVAVSICVTLCLRFVVVMRAKRGDAWAKWWDGDGGGMSGPGDTATRDEKI
jgi:hypothetical protein